jgi:hypothetical protein
MQRPPKPTLNLFGLVCYCEPRWGSLSRLARSRDLDEVQGTARKLPPGSVAFGGPGRVTHGSCWRRPCHSRSSQPHYKQCEDQPQRHRNRQCSADRRAHRRIEMPRGAHQNHGESLEGNALNGTEVIVYKPIAVLTDMCDASGPEVRLLISESKRISIVTSLNPTARASRVCFNPMTQPSTTAKRRPYRHLPTGRSKGMGVNSV